MWRSSTKPRHRETLDGDGGRGPGGKGGKSWGRCGTSRLGLALWTLIGDESGPKWELETFFQERLVPCGTFGLSTVVARVSSF